MSPSVSSLLAADSKHLCVIWDIPAVTTRIVTENHSGLTLPGGYQLLQGALAQNDTGSTLDVSDDSLTVGTSSFVLADQGGAITTWLRSNDGRLHNTIVYRREGFIGAPESEYNTTRWLFRDYAVSTKTGGGYEISLDNMLGSMSRPLYKDFDSETYRLGSVVRNGSTTNASAVITGLSTTTDLKAGMACSGTNIQDLARILSVDSGSQVTLTKTATGTGTSSLTFNDLVSSDTTVHLEKSPKGIWREPGFAVVYDQDARQAELISYQSIGGTGNLDLLSCTRRYLGVGVASYMFLREASNVSQVWVKRGNPIDVMLEWLTSSANGQSPAEKLTNGTLDTWASATDASNWTETITGGSINREASVKVQGTYGCRADRTGAGALTLHQDLTGLAVDRWFRVRIWCKASAAITAGLRVTVRNVTANKDVGSDGTTWSAPTQVLLSSDVGTTGVHFWIAFKTDPTFNAGDTYRVILDAANIANGQSIYWDVVSLFGPFTAIPNGPYDVGSDGLGTWLDYSLLNLSRIEAVRDAYWPIPEFAADVKSNGTAVLFVEREPIDDVKAWIRDHILRPFGMFPTVDSQERFSIEAWYSDSPSTAALGLEWNLDRFSASQWKRAMDQRINYASLLTDWDIDAGRHAYRKGRQHDPSILRFGLSKSFEMSGRGCRTGRRGFPDYGSIADLDAATTRLFQEGGNPWSEVTVEAFWRYKDLAIGQSITISIPNVPNLVGGGLGIVDGVFLITKKRLDWEAGVVRLTLRLRRSLTRAAVIAPNSVASSYTAASTADRAYCYIAPGATFANGDDAYTVQ